MIAYALMTEGDESDVLCGIVVDPRLAGEWADRGPDNTAEEYVIDEMPPIERYRDTNLFPYAPPPPPEPGSWQYMLKQMINRRYGGMFEKDSLFSAPKMLPVSTGGTIRFFRYESDSEDADAIKDQGGLA